MLQQNQKGVNKMEQYFKDVVSDLSMDDMLILGILNDNDATATFKAINNSDVSSQSKLSEATFRKIINRLIANKLISAVTLKRQHSLYITHYGVHAIKTTLEEVTTSA